MNDAENLRPACLARSFPLCQRMAARIRCGATVPKSVVAIRSIESDRTRIAAVDQLRSSKYRLAWDMGKWEKRENLLAEMRRPS